MSSQLSKSVKDFLSNFEYVALPKLIAGQKFNLEISSTSACDPQLAELLGIDVSNKTGKFMGVAVRQIVDFNIKEYGDV